jgi:hypothetical protein
LALVWRSRSDSSCTSLSRILLPSLGFVGQHQHQRVARQHRDPRMLQRHARGEARFAVEHRHLAQRMTGVGNRDP